MATATHDPKTTIRRHGAAGGAPESVPLGKLRINTPPTEELEGRLAAYQLELDAAIAALREAEATPAVDRTTATVAALEAQRRTRLAARLKALQDGLVLAPRAIELTRELLTAWSASANEMQRGYDELVDQTALKIEAAGNYGLDQRRLRGMASTSTVVRDHRAEHSRQRMWADRAGEEQRRLRDQAEQFRVQLDKLVLEIG